MSLGFTFNRSVMYFMSIKYFFFTESGNLFHGNIENITEFITDNVYMRERTDDFSLYRYPGNTNICRCFNIIFFFWLLRRSIFQYPRCYGIIAFYFFFNISPFFFKSIVPPFFAILAIVLLMEWSNKKFAITRNHCRQEII